MQRRYMRPFRGGPGPPGFRGKTRRTRDLRTSTDASPARTRSLRRRDRRRRRLVRGRAAGVRLARARGRLSRGDRARDLLLRHAERADPAAYRLPARREREFFKKLITVPNVGPTTATRALAFSVSAIARWIEAGDTAALGRLPGIGKRTAETIVAQLRGKVGRGAARGRGLRGRPHPPKAPPRAEIARDAIDALVALGYDRGEAERLVQQVEAASPRRRWRIGLRAVFRRLNPRDAADVATAPPACPPRCCR